MRGKKRILLVHCHEISLFPPVLNLLDNLLHNGHAVTLMTKDNGSITLKERPGLRLIRIPDVSQRTAAGELLLHGRFRNSLRAAVRREMERHDVLWTTTDCTVRELGDEVLRHRHVMQVLELIRDIPRFPYQNRVMLHIDRYARAAWKVVVPEYNRAHIQRVFWRLDKVPVVLPNKPYKLYGPLPEGQSGERIRQLTEEMRSEPRRILLYQGTFEEDRDLSAFAEAAEKNAGRYCLYIMGRDNDLRERLCRQYPGVRYIPFIAPPDHLRITECADFGLLPYIPAAAFHYSPLNALYCAPNKIFEYAAFGVPMVGTKVPGLEIPFSRYRIGICCDQSAEEIERALDLLLRDYEERSKNCRQFFDSVDLDSIVERDILEEGRDDAGRPS